MKSIALIGITAYQRYVSPRKGFCCAYRTWTGRRSCSMLGYRAIRRHGVLGGIAILRRRFARCADALDALRTAPQGIGRQRGYCDCSCDVPTGDCGGDWSSACSCCATPGDCGEWGRRKETNEPLMVEVAPGRWETIRERRVSA